MFFRLLELSLNSDNNKIWTFLQRTVVGLSALFIFVFIKNRNGGAAGAEFLLIHFKIVYLIASIVCLISFTEIIQDYRRDETLALLLMTGVSIPKLLLSVFSGKLLLLLAIIVVQIPFCIYAVTLGGVTVDMVLNLFISSSLWLILMACLGALLSGIFSNKNESIVAGIVSMTLIFISLDLLGVSPLQSLNGIILGTANSSLFLSELIWAVAAVFMLVVLIIKFEKFYFSPIRFWDDHVEQFRVQRLTAGYSDISFKIKESSGRKTVRFDKNPIMLKDQFLHPWSENSSIYNFFGSAKNTTRYLVIGLIVVLYFYSIHRFSLPSFIIAGPFFCFFVVSMWMNTFKAFKAEIDEETLNTLLILPISTEELLKEKLKYLNIMYAMTIFTYLAFCTFMLLLWFMGSSPAYTKFMVMVFCLPILKKSIDYLTLLIIFIDRNSPGLSAGTVSLFAVLSFFMFPAFAIPVMFVFMFFAKKLLLVSLQKYGETC